MNRFVGEEGFQHGERPGVGVLLANLGSPDAPTPSALRRYLRQFLLDPRVIELSRLIWRPILEGIILRKRPSAVAPRYQGIWTDEGPPLIVISNRQARGLEERLRAQVGTPIHVAVGMRYGNPSISAALRELKGMSCRRILVLPLYPQYASATVGSIFDAVATELMTWRWVPETRFIHHYHDDPGYIRCLAATIREHWRDHGEPDRLILSFHGIPRSTFLDGDPYHCECHKTARLVAEELELAPEKWIICFQSRFGKEEWLEPYTDETIKGLARAGTKKLDVICPGFSADCLETLEEIGEENREIFEKHGGEALRYIPALNDRADHLDAIADVALEHLQGWVGSLDAIDEEKERAELEASRKRADALKARAINTTLQKADPSIYNPPSNPAV